MPSELERAAGELDAVCQPSLEQRQRGAPQRHVPGKGGQAHLRRELRVLVKLRAHGGAVAELEQVDDPPVARLERELSVAALLGELEHLAGHP